ncbi:hypothetical protein, partial [Morganella psychrotolerans]|uniref:hypothetical protein n=1 Tax=Morganella psychrotolerans TaxID=368603 RepID=UPI001A7E6F45
LKNNIFCDMSCECPHRLSDKLLKSVATYAAVAGLLRCCEAAYITLFTSEVKHLFFNFLLSFSLSARLSACCSVSVRAHYRELLFLHNSFFEFSY